MSSIWSNVQCIEQVLLWKLRMQLSLEPMLGKHLIVAICLSAYSIASFGACDDSFVARARHNLGYLDERNDQSEFVACKRFPLSESKSIVAIAKRQEGTEIGDGETMGNYNLDIALVDNRTAAAIRRIVLKDRFISDGYRFDGIEIDTANFAVAPTLRAIGIRANFHIDLGFTSSQSLSLFIPSGTTFKEILSDADMRVFYTTLRFPSCLNKTREATRTLAIGKQITRGYFDLIVTETLIDTRERDGAAPDEGCVSEAEHEETKTYTLRFNGKRYVVPAKMREFDCRVC